VAAAAQDAQERQRVTVDTFPRAESDLYMARFVEDGAFGTFVHVRMPTPIDRQAVIRMNRDTLYSYAVADLEAGPVTITLPEAGERFVSVQVISQDHYVPFVIYAPGEHTFTREDIGTRYVLFLARTFVDPENPDDLETVHGVQDAMSVAQGDGAAFEIPDWDTEQADRLRDALNRLAEANGGLESGRMFGPEEAVDPVQHLIGTAAGWGGNPPTDAYYSGVTPERNDGETIHRLTVGDVPVDGFWSISVYNADGYFEENALGRYSINDVTADRAPDGDVHVQFGGCTAEVPNCLPVTAGWNYLVRMYRPGPRILDGSWTFPVAQPVE
jgi:hypothetical protein